MTCAETAWTLFALANRVTFAPTERPVGRFSWIPELGNKLIGCHGTFSSAGRKHPLVYPMTLAPSGHPPVPSDVVHFEVEVDAKVCGWPSDPELGSKLSQLHRTGLELRIGQIVAYAGLHYQDEAQDHWKIGAGRARIQSAWQDLCNWSPDVALRGRDGKPKLVLAERKNARRKGIISEVLGVGVGLGLAIHLYDLPYRFWSPSPGLAPHDFSAPASNGGAIRLEARGRFARNNWEAAKAQVRKKFGQTNFTSAVGVIFAPRATPNTRSRDITVMDPDGPGEKESHARLRALLRHYAPFFRMQGFGEFATRILEIASLAEQEFTEYLQHGDARLRRGVFKRTGFSFRNAEFEGTAYEGIAWPRHLTNFDGSEAGCFYWGLWTNVIEAIREGELESVAEMVVTEEVVRVGNTVYITLADGTALAWAPDLQTLLGMPRRP